uniref:Galectin n=1 Tax=Globodera pallida TaxID=36090 RepID=A0A183BTD8_GLOPA
MSSDSFINWGLIRLENCLEELISDLFFEASTPTPTNTAKLTLSDLMAAESQYPIPYRSKLTEPFEPGQTLIRRWFGQIRGSVRGNDKVHVGLFGFDPILIRAHDSKFTIFADQKEVKEYEHRVPLSHVTHFSIDGDVLITQVHWGGKYYPVPYESGITGEGFGPGKTLLVFGTPEKKGKRFHINLLKKNGDIAIHLNPRFDEKAIVRNSLIAGEWGNEEREGKIPLEKGIGFDLKVINEEYAFQIFINDERYATYAHRVEPHDLHGLQIGGDVEITGIQIF